MSEVQTPYWEARAKRAEGKVRNLESRIGLLLSALQWYARGNGDNGELASSVVKTERVQAERALNADVGSFDEFDSPEALAQSFHDTYERLAPSFGYETRPDTKRFDPGSPNGRLMVAVCREILDSPLKKDKCFWPTGCSDSKRCREFGQCVAAWQNAHKDGLFGKRPESEKITP